MLDPKNEDVYNLWGDAEINLKNPNAAIKDYTLAIGLNTKNPASYIKRGMVKINQNDKAGACTDFNSAAALGSKAGKDAVVKYCK
jgi:tetratricopeptide (TPR) repeat protein